MVGLVTGVKDLFGINISKVSYVCIKQKKAWMWGNLS